MGKQVILIPKDIRETHQALIKLIPDLPRGLPCDIEIASTSVTVTCLDEGPYTLERIKFGWPGYRIETHIRKYASGKRAIDDVNLKCPNQRPMTFTGAEVAILPTWQS